MRLYLRYLRRDILLYQWLLEQDAEFVLSSADVLLSKGVVTRSVVRSSKRRAKRILRRLDRLRAN